MNIKVTGHRSIKINNSKIKIKNIKNRILNVSKFKNTKVDKRTHIIDDNVLRTDYWQYGSNRHSDKDNKTKTNKLGKRNPRTVTK